MFTKSKKLYLKYKAFEAAHNKETKTEAALFMLAGFTVLVFSCLNYLSILTFEEVMNSTHFSLTFFIAKVVILIANTCRPISNIYGVLHTVKDNHDV